VLMLPICRVALRRQLRGSTCSDNLAIDQSVEPQAAGCGHSEMLTRRCRSEEGYKYATGVVFGVTDLARCFHCSLCPRDALSRDQVPGGAEISRRALFASSGMCWYLWVTGVSLPIVLPYVGTISVETPEISGQRAIIHFVLFLLCFYLGFISKPKQL
jgi:hypothetical protein